jgi:hypothetical protein
MTFCHGCQQKPCRHWVHEMNIKIRAFRNICATCRHLAALETGREFEKIIDTEFTTFKCDVLGWKTREFYLMAPVEKDLSNTKTQICEFWEEWNIPENSPLKTRQEPPDTLGDAADAENLSD